ncbi:MAG TPA: SDR family NAD(P)-dependent oxidoreductase, partial [Saprospiraceae bacterium]|nr:SDR family NAD(P)-dependent oxidoreductase [Saprospiraceae bacterium]
MQLEGKVAIITGGSKGIGLAIAESMIKEGMKVGIMGRNKESLESAADYINSPNLLTIVSDVKEYSATSDAIDRVVNKFGSLDVVIANAGVGVFKDVDQLTIEDWGDTIDINLTGAF